MSNIGMRQMSVVLTSEQWRLVKYPLMIERRTKYPRWNVVNVSGYGRYIYVQLDVYGSFWQELDELFATYVEGWEKM